MELQFKFQYFCTSPKFDYNKNSEVKTTSGFLSIFTIVIFFKIKQSLSIGKNN